MVRPMSSYADPKEQMVVEPHVKNTRIPRLSLKFRAPSGERGRTRVAKPDEKGETSRFNDDGP
jgi:hypothetical protein